MENTFYCQVCNTSFARKYLLSQHYKSKKHVLRAGSTNNKLEYCHCGKSYTTNTALKYHQRSCQNAVPPPTPTPTPTEQEITPKSELLKELDSKTLEIEELKQEIDRLKAEKSVTNNNQIIETQNNNVTINVNAFGHENTDHISENRMLKYISHIHSSIPMLVKYIYCDPKHPENHTVKISNYRHPYIKIMNKNKKWENANKEQIKSKIITKSYYMLDTTYEGNKDKLSESIQRHFETMQEKFNDGEPDMMKNLNHDVDMVLMNGPG
jgi:hypothetical protein